MAPRSEALLAEFSGYSQAYGGAIGALAGVDYALARQDGWF